MPTTTIALVPATAMRRPAASCNTCACWTQAAPQCRARNFLVRAPLFSVATEADFSSATFLHDADS
eukprot:m.50502 g.50502  ORF g.50502 m.50502 type:complete len:66 (-) comp6232_c0_seq2:70-267(-)